MSETASTSLHCMLIPLRENLLLLPNTTVAEIVSLPQIKPADHSPDFWAGLCTWRSRQIPVIDLEGLFNNSTANSHDASRLCVLNSINTTANLNFYGLLCYGSPQLITLNESILKAVDGPVQNFIHNYINLANTTVIIPNLDIIEAAIIQTN